jgi:hypothetical protein
VGVGVGLDGGKGTGGVGSTGLVPGFWAAPGGAAAEEDGAGAGPFPSGVLSGDSWEVFAP